MFDCDKLHTLNGLLIYATLDGFFQTVLRQRILYCVLQLSILPCTKCSSGLETAVLCTFICLKFDYVFSADQ